MSEQALQFGEGRRLFGVLSLPASLNPGWPAIVIPNTGVEHRVGPNRLHVQICREMATLGFAALRFDLSGMGDSRLPSGLGRSDSVADQKAALDELQRIGVAQRFAVIGLCSGGNDAHLLAKVEPRLVAAAFIDHYTYPTARYRLTYVAQRVFAARRLGNFIARKLAELRGDAGDSFQADLIDYFRQPPREEFAADVQSFIDKRMALFFLFTGELQNLYNYRDQLLDICPSLRAYDGYRLHHFPQADHTFTRACMRKELIEALRDWVLGPVMQTLGSSAPAQHESRENAGASGGVRTKVSLPDSVEGGAGR